MLMGKMKVKQQRHILELHLFVNNMGDLFADSDNSFQMLKEYFLDFCCVFHNVIALDTT